jgi:hypothetical protein
MMSSGSDGAASAVFVRLTLVVASVAFVLLGLEGALRIAVPQWTGLVPQQFLTVGPGGVLAGVPNFDGRIASLFGEFNVPVRLDSRGFRNPPNADPTAPLAFVGDSFCFGWGVIREQSFPQLVADRLAVPFYNYCAVAADLLDDLRTVQTWMPRRPGGVTVLQVTFENDVLGYPSLDVADAPSDAVRGLSRSVISRWLMTHSALFNVTATLARRSAPIVALVRRLGLMSGASTTGAGGADPIEASVRMIRSIEQAAGGGRFLVVVVPPRPGQSQPVDYGAFVRALGQAGFDVLDPLAEPGLTITTIPGDGHWDATMHTAIAPRIADRLARGAQ